MNRLSEVRDAVRPAMKARLLLGGPPGSGKTRTALVIATALAEGGKPLVVDTEEESALTYADDFDFQHLAWHPPYDPRELAETLLGAGATYPVVVVDSLSHFWRAEGGTLDIAGGKFTGWKAARPAQRDLILSVLRLPVHVVLCVRSKVEYVQLERNGRQVVEKLGMAHEQDDSLEYEVNVSAEMNMEHGITIAKTRCKLLTDKVFPPGERHAAELAQVYADWLKGGEPLAEPEIVGALKRRMDALTPAEYRTQCKQRFVAEVGRPEYLRASHADAASTLVASFETAAPKPPAHPGGPVEEVAATSLAAASRPPSEAQRRALMAASTAAYPDRDARLTWAGGVLGRRVDSFAALPAADAAALLAVLDKSPAASPAGGTTAPGAVRPASTGPAPAPTALALEGA